MSEEKKDTRNIFEKMAAIAIELQTVAKNLEIKAGATTYKAVSEADVLRAVKPLEEKHRVYSFPFSRDIVESGTIESTDYKGNVKKQLYERIKTVYRFVNIDNTEEYIDMTTYGDGLDSGDKSVGKAMTYADKYALLKAYKIVTGEDPDQEASPELNGTNIRQAERKPLSAELLKEAEALGMEMPKVCSYLKKKAEDLTDEDLAACIAKKKANIAKKKAAVEEVA